MKRPANTKSVKVVEFINKVRFPSLGPRFEAAQGHVVTGVTIDEIWEASNKVFINIEKTLIVVPMSNVKYLIYSDEVE